MSVSRPALPLEDNVPLGIAYMLATTLFFVTLDAAAKYLMDDLPVVQVVWSRFIFHLVLVSAMLGPRLATYVRSNAPRLQLVRSALMVMTNSLFFIGLQFAPLTTATSIIFLGPILVTILAIPLLGETVGVRRWAGVAFGFAGAMIIIRPGSGVIGLAALFFLGTALSHACYQIMTRKIRERVNDPATAEKLIPKNHGFGLRRLPLESGYFEAYNRPNVRLVDLNEAPIERITPNGVRTMAEEHELDILVYATGFDGVTGGYDRIDIRGSRGRRLRDDWKDDLPKTFLGVLNDGFPNLLMVLGPHTSRGNIPRHIEKIVDFNAGLVRYMRENGFRRVEVRPEEADKWLAQVKEANAGRLAGKIPSWQTGVNANVPGRQTIRVLGYYGGAVRYRELAEKVAAGGYKELAFR